MGSGDITTSVSPPQEFGSPLLYAGLCRPGHIDIGTASDVCGALFSW
jgi:hypothetical protein